MIVNDAPDHLRLKPINNIANLLSGKFRSFCDRSPNPPPSGIASRYIISKENNP